MNAEEITKNDIVFFFNKYKYNSDLIYHLERKLLKESYDFYKWEQQRSEYSALTRNLFSENENLIKDYIEPAIQHPEKLKPEALKTFMLHQTFFLFENNFDTHIIDDLINAILPHSEILSKQIIFSAHMNLGISKTIGMTDTFENTINCFEKALSVFPNFAAADNDEIRIHMVFCRIYEMLAFCLHKSTDYNSFINIYHKTSEILSSGTKNLYTKMWGEEADFGFHIEYLMRFARIYGIFALGQNFFSLGTNLTPENKEAKQIIISWLIDEYKQEKKEGEINLMIFTYYNLYLEESNKITMEDLFSIYEDKFCEMENLPEDEKKPVFSECAFPVDEDPVDPIFSHMLDKMKLFNKTFSFTYVFLHSFLLLSEDKNLNKRIIKQIVNSFETRKYAQKGFSTDSFIINIIKNVAEKLGNEKEFLLFLQSVFVHRQIYSSIHFGMVSSLSGICLYHLLNDRPDLCIIPGIYSTVREVSLNKIEILKLIKNAALIHDIGKANLTQLVNLQFRPITDKEFARLKLHVIYGKQIIQDIDFLAKYNDFIEGHHKFWNDSQGYPENFKLNASTYKNLVNLISICDMIDTTTDTKGRNYAKQFTFEEMLEEMKRCAGTRYNPELVNYILENQQLLKEIKDIVTIGRNFNSFQTYQTFIQPTTSFSAQDEKKVSECNENLKNALPEFLKTCYSEYSDEKINEHVSSLFDGNYKRVFILHDSTNKIYGFFAGQIKIPIIGEPYFYLDEIIIHPAYRRLGYGTELMNLSCSKLKDENIKNIKINSFCDFSFESFFWISGFSQTERFLMEKNL